MSLHPRKTCNRCKARRARRYAHTQTPNTVAREGNAQIESLDRFFGNLHSVGQQRLPRRPGQIECFVLTAVFASLTTKFAAPMNVHGEESLALSKIQALPLR